jgi:hypothetical protein
MPSAATRERELTANNKACLLPPATPFETGNRGRHARGLAAEPCGTAHIPKDALMRTLALAIVAIGTIAAAGPAPAQTYDPRYPVCLHVYGPNRYYECSYTSLAQCNASASGRSADCIVNPYAANAEAPLERRDRHRRVY